MKKTILAIALLCLLAPACKKYQYGPYFALATKKQRVEGTWRIDSAINTAGSDIAGTFASYRFAFKKGGDTQIEFLPSTGGGVDTLFGEWGLEEEHDILVWKDLIGDTTGFYYIRNERFDILRLTGQEFWLTDKYNTYLYLSPE
ncbi:MAG: hypothetical protein IPL49_15825 [Saprospirales bacterium]|nr:hypothetical protein [Saprospirales bacterium]MBK8492305.1 hypothetical protein [Saprospirales bacterium]